MGYKKNYIRWAEENWLLLALLAVVVWVFREKIWYYIQYIYNWVYGKIRGANSNGSKKSTGVRGIRNNNPGNIVYSPNNDWDGKVSQNTDGSFEQFQSMAYGIRATLKLIQNYINSGHSTIDKIGRRWSGNAAGYVEFLESKTGFSKHTAIRADDYEAITALAMAIFKIETGVNFTTSEINAGWNLLNR